jgi:hypothetical protein
MQRKRAHRLGFFGTHMTRAPDDSMVYRFRKGDWLGITRCRRPQKGRDVIFINERGDMVVGEVMGFSADTWRIGQLYGQHRYTVKRLSRSRWRPAWRVVLVSYSDADGYYEAVALGLTDRAATIQRAHGGLGPMPPPLTDEQRAAIPRVVKMRP